MIKRCQLCNLPWKRCNGHGRINDFLRCSAMSHLKGFSSQQEKRSTKIGARFN